MLEFFSPIINIYRYFKIFFQKIRTNPWISRPENLINKTTKSENNFKRNQPLWSSFSCGDCIPQINNNCGNKWPIYATINCKNNDLLVSSELGAQQRLNESTCSGSSGYGSQDSR